jgi:basic membrane protein A and related proteins
MKRTWTVLLAGLALLLVGTATDSTAQAKKLKVAIVLPGVITDKAWNELGYNGIKTIEKDLGAEVAFVEKVAQPDQAEAMGDFARRGFDVVFGHGGEFDAAAKQVGAKFPKAWFVVTNGNVSGTNIASMQINHWQVAFLGGVAAGMMTKSNKLALITAQKFKAMDDAFAGFRDGAKWVNPKTDAAISYTGDWDDVGKAKEAALAHIAKGADVIAPNLDLAQQGGIDAAREKGVYAVGFVGDQYALAPKTILTSAIENIQVGMLEIAKPLRDGKLEGKLYVIGVENPKAAGYGKFGDMVPQKVKDKVAEAKKLMLEGKLKQQ